MRIEIKVILSNINEIENIQLIMTYTKKNIILTQKI
jgi:hypothetical protein